MMIEVEIFIAWTEELHAVATTAEDAIEALIESPEYDYGTLYRVARFTTSLPVPGVEDGGALTGGRPQLKLVT